MVPNQALEAQMAPNQALEAQMAPNQALELQAPKETGGTLNLHTKWLQPFK